MAESQEQEIAIIGIGCKLPGADNCDEFWQVLERGENHVVDIPKERWNTDAFLDKDKHAVGKSYVQRAGLLKDPLAFDNKLFKIMDFEADLLDPQQRYVLECSYMAMEDAGLTRHDLAGSKTGVYVGAMNSDYRSLSSGKSPLVDGYTVTGTSSSMISARVSYVFDLRGPAIVVDTACSSGLVAIHVAGQALKTGDCDMAFCGGTNFIMSPDVFVHLSKANMLSPSGQVHTFSDKADGYTRGEGCGMIILKRLQDAKTDGNYVYATIKTGSNHDGRTVSPISAPSEEQQSMLLHEIYDQSGIELDSLEYIEAHGTGTPAGDPVEVNALGKFFQSKNSVCSRFIGSVKTNIGHLESAAGIAGLIKVLLMMKHLKIVPSLFFEKPNPKIDFEGMKFKVPTELIDWPTQEKIACVNSFGFGGTNCHAIIKSVGNKDKAQHGVAKEKSKACIVCFSAKEEKSLVGSLQDFVNHQSAESFDVHDISYTATAHRDHYNVRYATVVETMPELLSKLKSDLQKGVKGSKAASRTRLVYIFGGMGTAWPGMCKEMMIQSNIFMKKIVEIDECLSHYVSWSLKEDLEQGFDVNDVFFSPIAIFACQVGQGEVWKSLGVFPDCVVGQSVGEVAAAYFAGILTLPDAVKIIYHRTVVLAKIESGGMIVVRNMQVELVKEVVLRYHNMACVSVEYSPVACAVSGSIECLSKIKEDLKSKAEEINIAIKLIDLSVKVAYHSPHVEGCKDDLEESIKDITPSSPQVQMISSVTGETVLEPLGPKYWVDNVCKPVLFCEAVKKSFKGGPKNMFIELGPKPVMAAHTGDIFTAKEVMTGVSMTEKSEWKIFLSTLATVYELGIKVKWRELPSEGRAVTPIPRYCFSYRRNLKLCETTHMLLAGVKILDMGHPFLFCLEVEKMYKIIITKNIFPTIYDHQVSGRLIIPGALYAEAGFAATCREMKKKAPLLSASIQFLMPFSFSREEAVELEVVIQDLSQDPEAESNGHCSIAMMKENKTLAKVYVQTHTKRKDPASICMARILGKCPEAVSHKEIYERLQEFGFVYGPALSLLKEAHTSSKTCVAKMCVAEDMMQEVAQTTIHPAVLDAMIQTSVLIVGDDNDKDLFPQSIEKLTPFMPIEPEMYVYTKLKRTEKNLLIYDCKLLTLSGQIIAEMENLTLKVVAAEGENKYMCSWKLMEKVYPTEESKEIRSLFITDSTNASTASDLLPKCIQFDVMNNPDATVTKNLELLLTKQEKFRAIIVFINTTINDSDDGPRVETKLLNLCMMIKAIYTFVVNEALTLPIFFFTKHAFPFPNEAEDTNPIMTSIWGMIRCALKEQIYTNTTTVDLHLPEKKCTLHNLYSFAEIIDSDNSHRNYPEWLVTEDKMYVNQIVQFENSANETAFRENFIDKSQRVILISKEPMVATDTFLIEDKNKAQELTGNFREMDVCQTAIQNPSVFSVQLPCNILDNDSTSKCDGYHIYGFEHVLQDADQVQYISCYPAPIGSKVIVPKESIFEKKSFRPGDFTRLIVLYSLSQLVTSKTVTILMSSATSAFSFVISHLLITKDPEIKTISMVMVDNMGSGTDIILNEAVISLELLDETVTSVLAKNWAKPKQLITVASLLSSDAESFISMKFPTIQVKSLDTKTHFLPGNIVNVLPQVKQWIQENISLMDQIATELHTDLDTHIFPKVVKYDLHKLLEKHEVVRVGETELFRKNAVYIVVGGLTGLGSLIVKFLAENGAEHIAILNRRQATPENKTTINELSTSTKSQIKVFHGDVTDMDSLKKVMVAIGETFPRAVVKGVFFGAAVLDDKALLETDSKRFAKVLSPKVNGAWNFHLLTRNLTLDYFVLLSSVTSVFGNPGQTSYGAGNAFMDGLAHYRRHRKLAGQSINWGALEVGMLKNNQKVKDILESQGFLLIKEEEIFEMMMSALLLNFGQITMCKFNKDALQRQMKKDMLTPYQYRLKAIMSAPGGETRMKQDDLIQLQKVRDLLPDQRIELYERYIIALAKQVLDIEDDTIGSDSNLQDLGVNSINFLAMMNQIFKELNCRLPPVIFLSSDSTVKTVAQAIDNILSTRQADDV